MQTNTTCPAERRSILKQNKKILKQNKIERKGVAQTNKALSCCKWGEEGLFRAKVVNEVYDERDRGRRRRRRRSRRSRKVKANAVNEGDAERDRATPAGGLWETLFIFGGGEAERERERERERKRERERERERVRNDTPTRGVPCASVGCSREICYFLLLFVRACMETLAHSRVSRSLACFSLS
jgi:hypothetical protein